jgi:hypothetical protein
MSTWRSHRASRNLGGPGGGLYQYQRMSKVQLALAARPLDESRAFDLLEEAVEERDPHLLDALRWRWWGYRDHPRYQVILNRMGLDLEGDRLVPLGGGI